MISQILSFSVGFLAGVFLAAFYQILREDKVPFGIKEVWKHLPDYYTLTIPQRKRILKHLCEWIKAQKRLLYGMESSNNKE